MATVLNSNIIGATVIEGQLLRLPDGTEAPFPPNHYAWLAGIPVGSEIEAMGRHRLNGTLYEFRSGGFVALTMPEAPEAPADISFDQQLQRWANGVSKDGPDLRQQQLHFSRVNVWCLANGKRAGSPQTDLGVLFVRLSILAGDDDDTLAILLDAAFAAGSAIAAVKNGAFILQGTFNAKAQHIPSPTGRGHGEMIPASQRTVTLAPIDGGVVATVDGGNGELISDAVSGWFNDWIAAQ